MPEKVVPPKPTTKIPGLGKLTDKQYRAVVEIVGCASRVQERDFNPTGGVPMRWRVELAAAFLAATLDHAVTAAKENDDDADVVTGLALRLTIERAQEIVRQGSA